MRFMIHVYIFYFYQIREHYRLDGYNWVVWRKKLPMQNPHINLFYLFKQLFPIFNFEFVNIQFTIEIKRT